MELYKIRGVLRIKRILGEYAGQLLFPEYAPLIFFSNTWSKMFLEVIFTVSSVCKCWVFFCQLNYVDFLLVNMSMLSGKAQINTKNIKGHSATGPKIRTRKVQPRPSRKEAYPNS
jgi:hypothetical protein